MNRSIIFIICGLLLHYITIAQMSIHDPHWNIAFKDTFDTLNTNIWQIKDNFDHYGGLPVFCSQNVYINNNTLILEAKKEPYCCDTIHVNEWECKKQWLTGECYQYSSGYIETKSVVFKYGYVEAKIRLPAGNGFFPAFWLFRAPNVPPENANEIDIFEMDGAKTTTMGTNLHMKYCNPDICKKYNYDCNCPYLNAQNCPDIDPTILCYGQHVSIPSYTTWRTYAVEWSSEKIIWYVDGQMVRNFPNPGIHDYVRIILNFGLASSRPPDQSTPFPSIMEVDYVKVYQLRCDKNTPVYEITNYDNPQAPNYYNYAVKKLISLSGTSSLTAGQNVSLRAAEYIELTNGFEVPLGAELYLDISPCEMVKTGRQ